MTLTIKELTPAQKAQRTRSANKANAAYEEMVASAYVKWLDALDRNAPIRDAYIDKLQAKRDAAIAEINRQYEEDYAIQMAQFNHMMKPTNDALALARKNAWAIWGQAIIGNQSFDEAAAN
jgi:hypothetical protein